MLILTQNEYDMLQRLLRVNNYSYDQFTRLEMETLRSLADRHLISFEDNQQVVRRMDYNFPNRVYSFSVLDFRRHV